MLLPTMSSLISLHFAVGGWHRLEHACFSQELYKLGSWLGPGLYLGIGLHRTILPVIRGGWEK
jgi:hypothetical protein